MPRDILQQGKLYRIVNAGVVLFPALKFAAREADIGRWTQVMWSDPPDPDDFTGLASTVETNNTHHGIRTVGLTPGTIWGFLQAREVGDYKLVNLFCEHGVGWIVLRNFVNCSRVF